VSAVRHYLPVLVALGVFALVVALVPSTVPRTTGSQSAPASAVGPTPPAPDRPGASGVAVSGVQCGPGVRQVTWSKYAPLCQPAFHGDNGGATAPGVTATTITVTYREAITPAEQALQSLIGKLVGTNTQAIAAMDTYISVFNREFELYGRKVVLKPFEGKGDFLAEDDGGGQAQAAADADTAKSLGAFADISLLATTPPYTASLAADHVITIGGNFESITVLRRLAPFDYETAADCQKIAAAGVQIIGRAMGGLPAIYAGSAAMRREKRVFALIAPNNSSYNQCSDVTVSLLEKDYGIKVAKDLRYPLNLSGGQELAANTVAQLKSAGVTTVVCSCDPVTPIFLTADANAVDYHPEWFSINFGDAYNRLPSQTQWSHSMAGGSVPVPRVDDEAYRAYRMAQPTGAIIPTYASIYEPLLLFFDALQAAGPDLTPQNFQRGMNSLPPSASGGMFGPWKFGPSTFDPLTGFQVMWWDPTAVDPQDGQVGVYRACNGGETYGFDGTPSLPLHRQLQCFGDAPPVRSP
jgi:hypothetical protein